MTLPPGCRVLLVEDESLVAMVAEDTLLDLGCEVVLAMRLDAALSLAREADVQLGVLDVNLGEGRSYPVADILRARGIPFLFATGYSVAGLDPPYRARRPCRSPTAPASSPGWPRRCWPGRRSLTPRAAECPIAKQVKSAYGKPACPAGPPGWRTGPQASWEDSGA